MKRKQEKWRQKENLKKREKQKNVLKDFREEKKE